MAAIRKRAEIYQDKIIYCNGFLKKEYLFSEVYSSREEERYYYTRHADLPNGWAGDRGEIRRYIGNGRTGKMYEGNEGNPYEKNSRFLQQTARRRKQPNPQRTGGIALTVFGTVVLVFGLLLGAVEGLLPDRMAEPSGSPEDVFFAENTGEYSYAKIKYMTDRIAYEEDLQLHIVCDYDLHPAVVAIRGEDIDLYLPYIYWLYSDSFENEPEELLVTGYAKPFDAELAENVIQGFAENFGDDIVDKSNFTEWFGGYYLEIRAEEDIQGGRTSSGVGFLTGAAGLIVLIAGIVLLCTARTRQSGSPSASNTWDGGVFSGRRMG